MRVTTALPLTWGVAAAGGRSSSGNGLGMGLGHLSFVGLGRTCRLGLSVRLGVRSPATPSLMMAATAKPFERQFLLHWLGICIREESDAQNHNFEVLHQ